MSRRHTCGVTASDELRDPWGWLVAAVIGGVGWAVLAGAVGGLLALVLGIGIGAAVLSAKVALGSRGSVRQIQAARRDELPKPPRDSPQAHLVRRAGLATDRLRDLSERPGDDWLRAEVARVDDEAIAVSAGLVELAGRVTVVDASLLATRPGDLVAERRRLADLIETEAGSAVRGERERTVAAIDGQLAALGRLGELRETLLARMQTAVLGLEGLASRVGELVAMGTSAVAPDRAADVLRGLTSDLDTLRGGLAEAEALSKDMPA